MKLTGERVTTCQGGFNPTFQRHVAAYRLCAPLFGNGKVLDLGCGIGHSVEWFGTRPSLGLDLDLGALVDQQRPVIRADMRSIPLRDGAVSSVVSIQSLEHVPDPERVLAEAARILTNDGRAVWVTPNRLTFARADEVIDPWHYREFDQSELVELCGHAFSEVELCGLFGSERYLRFQKREIKRLNRLLRMDPLRLRRYVPRSGRQWAYSTALKRTRRSADPLAMEITEEDFYLSDVNVNESLDLIALCRHPRR
jgi:SAM-dependent methyltransferase